MLVMAIGVAVAMMVVVMIVLTMHLGMLPEAFVITIAMFPMLPHGWMPCGPAIRRMHPVSWSPHITRPVRSPVARYPHIVHLRRRRSYLITDRRRRCADRHSNRNLPKRRRR